MVQVIIRRSGIAGPGSDVLQPLVDETEGYKDDAETAAAAAAADAATVAEVSNDEWVGAVDPIASGSVVLGSSFFYWPQGQQAFDQWVTQIETGMGTGGTFVVVVATVNGSNQLTLLDRTVVQVLTGGNIVTSLPEPMYVPPNAVVGISRLGGTWYYLSGTIPDSESIWFTAAEPTVDTARTVSTTNAPRFKVRLEAKIAYKANAGEALVPDVGVNKNIGFTGLVDTGTNLPANFTVIFRTPLSAGDHVVSVGAGVASDGSLEVFTCSVTGGNATKKESVTVPFSAGVLTAAIDLVADEGDYVGMTNIGANPKYQNASNPEGIAVWFRAGAITTGTAVTESEQHGYELNFEVKSGLLATAELASRGSTSGSGLGLLDAADSTGVIDATTIFEEAKAAHPTPNVPAGDFLLTSMPANGNGFWGAGKVRIGTKRFFIPRDPRPGSLYEGTRNRLAEHIAAGNIISLVSDSIGQWAYASTALAHHFNLFTCFCNYGIAPDDEPGMTALRSSSSYTPAFYGVTFTGTWTTGTTGPIAESAVGAAGAVLTFTGVYETIGFHFEQGAGVGSIVVKRGATTLTTIVGAGATEHDKYSGDIPTGVTASATYTLEITGAAVEITGLTRLGVKVADTQPRLRTNRCAHGSYTIATFTSAMRASIMKQGQAGGGAAVPIIDLGVNDSFSTPPATIGTGLATMIDDFVAQGAPEIFGVLPIRPGPVWDATYTGGRTYTPAQGAIAKVYRQKGVTILPMPMDFLGQGDLQDELHSNDGGMDDYAQMRIEAFCR